MGILQARTLEWVVMPSSRASSQTRDQTSFPALQVDSLPFEPSEELGQRYVYENDSKVVTG